MMIRSGLLGLLYGVVVCAYAHQGTLLAALPSSGLALTHQVTMVKHLPPKTNVSFVVWPKMRNLDGLYQLARDVYDPSSPRYQQFLTKEMYQQQHEPGEDAMHRVEQFFSSRGMHTTRVQHSIEVSGAVEQIERTLHVKMNLYRHKNKLVHAHDRAPQIDSEVAQYIAEITGLSAIPEFDSNESSVDEHQWRALHFLWNQFAPKALPTDISLHGFSGANLQKAYNLGNVPAINGVAINGAGQTLVVVDKCGANGASSILSDANQYFRMNGIQPFIRTGPKANFAMINADGTPYTTCANEEPFSREVVLDIEASHTIAPGNNTVLVLGSGDQRTTLMHVIDTLINHHNVIAGYPNAYVISNSWSGVEMGTDPALESSLALAAAAGISVNFSSGDCGDNTYATEKKCTGASPSAPKVDYPSSSPYVTAVGATTLFVDAAYNYAFETVWGAVKHENGTWSYDGGTGGGISQIYGPVDWQSAIHHFTAGGYGEISNYGHRRALPDIAMLGAPQTGLLIIAEGTQVQDGGTSLACPLFSATLTLVNQARALLNKPTPIGQAAPYLYQMNQHLLEQSALNLIVPPAQIISGATPPLAESIQGTPAPASAFSLGNKTFGWDSSLTIEPEDQFWNDAVGVGSPNIPHFVMTMANL